MILEQDSEINYSKLIDKLDKTLLNSTQFTQMEREEILEDLASFWIKKGLLI